MVSGVSSAPGRPTSPRKPRKKDGLQMFKSEAESKVRFDKSVGLAGWNVEMEGLYNRLTSEEREEWDKKAKEANTMHTLEWEEAKAAGPRQLSPMERAQ